jgi:hypothetical protein
VGETVRRGDEEGGRLDVCERWPERFLVAPVPGPKRSDLIDSESSLDSSSGSRVFSARRLNEATLVKSDRTFTFIGLCYPFPRETLMSCSPVYLLP